MQLNRLHWMHMLHMHWIAAQYKTDMPRGYQLPTSCSQSRGRKDGIEKSSEN